MLKVQKDAGKNTLHPRSKRRKYDNIKMSNLSAKLKRIITGAAELKVVVPLDSFQAHIQMSRIWAGRGEYSTLLEMREVSEGVFRVVDWYMPYHNAGPGYATLNRRGAIDIASTQLERLEHLYGVFHIHPGYGSYTPGMSGVDVNAMWTWISNADRGVFVVSNSAGNMSAVYVCKDGDSFLQIPMDVEVDWSMPDEDIKAIRDMMDERITEQRYDYGMWGRSIHVPARVKDSIRDTPVVPDVKDESVFPIVVVPEPVEVQARLTEPYGTSINKILAKFEEVGQSSYADADIEGGADMDLKFIRSELRAAMDVIDAAREGDRWSTKEAEHMGLGEFLTGPFPDEGAVEQALINNILGPVSEKETDREVEEAIGRVFGYDEFLDGYMGE